MNDLVIALHGAGRSRDAWCALAARLEPACRLVVVDLVPARGRGEASPTLADEAARIEPLLKVLARTLRSEDALPRLHLLGHAHGGAVALKLATRLPQLVHSVAVFEPLVFPVLLEGRNSAARSRDLQGAVEAMARGGDRASAEAADDEIGMLLAPFRTLAHDAALDAALPKLGARALVLAGEAAVPAARRIAERLRRLMPLARHAWLPAGACAGSAADDRFIDFLKRHGVSVPPPAPATRPAFSHPDLEKALT